MRRVPSTLADEYPVQSERPFGFAGKQQNIYLGKSLTHLPVRVFIDAERISRRLCVDIHVSCSVKEVGKYVERT